MDGPRNGPGGWEGAADEDDGGVMPMEVEGVVALRGRAGQAEAMDLWRQMPAQHGVQAELAGGGGGGDVAVVSDGEDDAAPGGPLPVCDNLLRKGGLFCSKEDFRVAVGTATAAAGGQTKVGVSRPTVLRLICPAGGACTFKANANRQRNTRWKVASICLQHTCTGAAGQRQRQEPVRVLKRRAPAVDEFVLNKKGGNAKQLQRTLKGQNVDMKLGQVHSIIREKAVSGFATAFGEMCYVEAWIKSQKESDPGGCYQIVVDEEFTHDALPGGGRQLTRTFIAPSASKAFWGPSRKHVSVDGTFLTGALGGCLLTAVAHDANNQIVPLAFGHVWKETKESWGEFLASFAVYFGVPKVLLCDGQKGLVHLFNPPIRALVGVRLARCAKHLVENLYSNMSNPVSRKAKVLVWAMIKACTKEQYERLKDELSKEHVQAAEWMHERKDSFATYVFLEEGLPRFGQTTSNAAEQYNNVLKPARGLPIISLYVAILANAAGSFRVRHTQGLKWRGAGMVVTPSATKEMNRRRLSHTDPLDETTITASDEERLACTVTIGSAKPPRTMTMALSQAVVDPRREDASLVSVQDPCKMWVETGILCKRLLRMITLAQGESIVLANVWQYTQAKWYHPVYHINSYIAQYAVAHVGHQQEHALECASLLPPPPDSKPNQIGVLPLRLLLLIPLHKKKRREQQEVARRIDEGEEGRHHRCKACNMCGHLAKGCAAPDHVILSVNFAKEIAKYCKGDTKILHDLTVTPVVLPTPETTPTLYE